MFYVLVLNALAGSWRIIVLYIMMRDFERALTERTKSVFDIFFLKINEENFKKNFDVKKDNLFYNIVT